MALYPYTVATQLPTTAVPLDPGSAMVFPFSLAAAQRVHIDLIQADQGGRVQDFTIRAWVSETPMGNPDPSLPQFVQSWQPNKIPNTIVVCVFDRASQGSDKTYAIPADPGSFYLNVLNLTNQTNQFWLTID